MPADYVIVGAGSAGRVLPNSLTEDPATRVVLSEAGGRDWNPLIHIPAGFMKLLARAERRRAPRLRAAERLDGLKFLRRLFAAPSPGEIHRRRKDAGTVDSELKVHGLDALRVIDASVMPTVSSTNTNAPTITIAEKGAEMIRASARQRLAA